MRRGQPTVHKAYDEMTAVLAGDALQAAAFEILAHHDTHPDGNVRAELVARLATASGARGMVGGQMIDMLGVREDLGGVARMQRLKTGALIACAFDLPLVLADARWTPSAHALLGLRQRSRARVSRSSTTCWTPRATPRLGKAAGKDAEAGKTNFVTCWAWTAPSERLRYLLKHRRNQHLASFGSTGRNLCSSTVDFRAQIAATNCNRLRTSAKP